MYNPEYLNKLEQELEQRLLERYREGVISEALSDYFEYGEDNSYNNVIEQELEELSRNLSEKTGRVPSGTETGFFAQNSSQISQVPHTNRGVTFNRNTSLSAFGGYDGGIELGLTGVWQVKEFQQLKQVLEYQKELAISKNTLHKETAQIFELNGKTFIMCPKSVIAGAAYRYVIEGIGVKIYIHTNARGDIQPIRIHYLAVGLIGRDFFLKHSEIREFIESLGFEIQGEKLSRVDMQVMLNVPVTEFIRAFNEERVVTPAQTYRFIRTGKSEESVSVGSELRVSIYDKRKELKTQLISNPVKVALMLDNVLGNDFFETDTPLTRIEFQLHRSVLRDFGINSVQDLLEHETAIARYCSNRYFRILKEPKKRGHTSKQVTSEIWLQVQSRFLEVFPGVEGHREEIKRNKNNQVCCSAERLHLQVYGCLATSAVLELGSGVDILTVIRYALERVCNGAQRFYSRYLERAAELSAQVFGAGVNLVLGSISGKDVENELDSWYQKIRKQVQLELDL
jgi:hypothetical protein